MLTITPPMQSISSVNLVLTSFSNQEKYSQRVTASFTYKRNIYYSLYYNTCNFTGIHKTVCNQYIKFMLSYFFLIQWIPLICKAYLSEKILQLSGLCDKTKCYSNRSIGYRCCDIDILFTWS